MQIIKKLPLFIMILMYGGCSNAQKTDLKMKPYNILTDQEEYVILRKGTERPFTGRFYDFWESGTYVCRQCNAPLFQSAAKFDAGCGWPSFDSEIDGAVNRQPDADGYRTEIVCASCGGHLGHVFTGEGFTPKNTRHCVNSISMDFIADRAEGNDRQDTAIFAGGCFWGVEYYFRRVKGVSSVKSGYTGGHVNRPDYRMVCSGTTGHAEAVEIVFNPGEVSYETLARLFFEIHDPTQLNRQGPDIGTQYRSAVFYTSEAQRKTAEHLIEILRHKGLRVVTQVERAGVFWPAEAYHQDYYRSKGGTPYCHAYTPRF